MSERGRRAPRGPRTRPVGPIWEILEEERAPRAAEPVGQELTMAGILQALGAIGDLMGQQVRNQNAAAAVASEAPHVNPLVEQFLKLKPPKFSGSGDPEAATSWIEELEKAFDPLRCTNEDKVTLVVNRLQGNASTWWRTSKDRVFPEGTVPTWDAFVEAFNGKYFYDTAREQKMAEFFRLRQNQMTIDQYEAKFAELSKYAPRLVEDPVDRARRFRDGLKPEIGSVLISFNLKDYNDLYERARMVEQDPTERAAASGSRFAPLNRRDIHQGKKPMQGNRFNVPPNRRGAISKPMPHRDDVRRLCNQRHGSGSCGMRGVCFGCGRRGHPVRDCPQRQQARPLGGQVGRIAPPNHRNRPRAQGRVFAITRDEAKDSPTVTSTVLLQNSVAYALFDPGATHSFVADQFVRLSRLIVVPLDVVVKVSTPLKDSVIAAVGCPSCRLVVDGHESEIDPIVLEMYDFDLIVGMGWLTKQRATMDCYRTAIQFRPLDGAGFEFVGNRGGTSIVVISSLEATRLLESGCQGYLAATFFPKNCLDCHRKGKSSL
ncbi:uncharacterized protein LOC125314643 [Rhodamnia argentea]|uniref:Uncharacterized protein LOC125314643 n=1 Tax=Rhodamnia argentea TaxID=178133 RepID=A0ABM3HA18_9MYRT|nr:uncharacterized protein LOC125314643 [Rhodamnia argentea]